MGRITTLVAAAAALIVALTISAQYAASQPFTPPSSHNQELGVPGVFTALHAPGYDAPFDNGCTLCHGEDLQGGFAPSCFTCHGAFWDPTQPQFPDSHTVKITGNSHRTQFEADCKFCHAPHRRGASVRSTFWHAPGLQTPYQSGCALCHGPNLDGVDGIAFSCFFCHGQLWSDCPPVNLPPVADPNGPYSGDAGDPVSFDGTRSFDPDGTIVFQDWDFGDGDTAAGPAPNHTYAAAGAYDVTLTVTDDGGLTHAAATTAVISEPANSPPVANPGGPYSGDDGAPVFFDGSLSSDADGTIVSYDWDFGDGNTSAGPTPNHTYASGIYSVTLTVTDDGGATASATTTAEIADGGPGPGGSDWIVRVPFFSDAGFELRIEQADSILWVEESFPDGRVVSGIGAEVDNIIYWIDAAGAFFLGIVDRDAGNMMGIVYNFMGSDTIWIAEPAP